MIGVPYSSRLEQLRALRRRIDIEIAAEERLDAARRAAQRAAAEERRRATNPTSDEVRSWAQAQGIPVGQRGRIPASVRQQYLEAHGGVAQAS